MNLPTMVSLRDLGDWSGGNTPSKANPAYWTDGTVPWVSPKDMKADEIVSSIDRITERALAEGRVSLVPKGSVLFVTRSGILAHTFPVAVTNLPVTINQDLKALVPKKGISSKYVAHALRGLSRRILKECAKHGTTVASIDTNALLNFMIPMVDLDAQHRIVAEIEKQFSRLDEAVANLKCVKANLKRYKAAVLKAAVEGNLLPPEAEIARGKAHEYEAGDALLQRILDERRNEWKGKGPYKPPAAPRIDGFPPLPKGWTYGSLEAITSSNRVICYGILMPKENVADGVLFVKVRDMKEDVIDLSSLHRTLPSIAKQYERASLVAGDLLLAIRGTYGRVAAVPPELNGSNITQDTARVAVNGLMDKGFVAAYLRSEDAQRYFKRVARGVAVKGVNIGDIRPMAIPVPPYVEQRRIVEEVERRLSLLRGIEATTNANLKRAERMRQAILVKMFAAPGARVWEEVTS